MSRLNPRRTRFPHWGFPPGDEGDRARERRKALPALQSLTKQELIHDTFHIETDALRSARFGASGGRRRVMRLEAQGVTATIQGTVTDASGAVIAAGDVQVKNVDTGQTQNTKSDAQGAFWCRIWPWAIMRCRLEGRFLDRSPQRHRAYRRSPAGSGLFAHRGTEQQTVTVEGQVTEVETTDATVGSLINQTQMAELPLNGRDFEQLIQLAPACRTITPAQRRSTEVPAPTCAKEETRCLGCRRAARGDGAPDGRPKSGDFL